MAGSLWGGNDGAYYLIQCGDTLVHGTVANFGTDSTHSFISDTCTPPPPVPGCMDPEADNYNADATEDDGSCSYPVSCDLDEVTVSMTDSYGDGWNGNTLSVGDQ